MTRPIRENEARLRAAYAEQQRDRRLRARVWRVVILATALFWGGIIWLIWDKLL